MPSERLTLRLLQIGAVAVVLIATTLHAFDLDRFFVPKELVLHVAAFAALALTARAVWRSGVARVDLLLTAYLLLSGISALLATNRWLALRGLAISASGVAIFWAARVIRDRELARPLLGALAVAVVVTSLTSLAQAYGLNIDFFSLNRAPGGTLGNRNFVAHVAAFGLPLLIVAALRARRAYFGWCIGTAFAASALVLTRSRAAWLSAAAVLLIVLGSMIASTALRANGRMWGRLFGLAIIAGCGVLAVLALPNALHWRSENPYLETMRRVAEYQQGSGRGRLVQYGQSLSMAVHHPLFGVGPGNWAVEYPVYAVRHDPSLSDSEGGMTNNPWPSSDWFAVLSERGFAAFVVLALVFLQIARGGLRQISSAVDADTALIAVALLGTVIGAAIAGTFDAVLLLAVPAFLVWAAAGALFVPTATTPRPWFAAVVLAVLAITAAGAYRSAAQLLGMEIYSTRGDRAALTRAAQIDPGNYRLRLRLARLGGRARCEHARAAHALFPHADAAAAAARGCGK